MAKLTVKEHAAAIAKAVAKGAETRIAYSKVVAEADLTMGELAALRHEIDQALVSLLRKQGAALAAIADHCQQRDPKTGYLKPADGAAIMDLIHAGARA